MNDLWYLLRCFDCKMNLPFPDHGTRSGWLDEHITTGHQKFLLWVEDRDA